MPLALEVLLITLAVWAATHALHVARGRPLTSIEGPLRSWLRRGRQEAHLSAAVLANLLVWGIRHDHYKRHSRLLTRRRNAGTKLAKAEPKLERRDAAHQRGLDHLKVLYARVREMPELAHSAPKWLKAAASAGFAIDLVMFSFGFHFLGGPDPFGIGVGLFAIVAAVGAAVMLFALAIIAGWALRRLVIPLTSTVKREDAVSVPTPANVEGGGESGQQDERGFGGDPPTSYENAPRWVWPIVVIIALAGIVGMAKVTAVLRAQAQAAQQGAETSTSASGPGLLHAVTHAATMSNTAFVVITLASAATAMLASFEEGRLAHAIRTQKWINHGLAFWRDAAARRVAKFRARREILRFKIDALNGQTAMLENIAIGQAGVDTGADVKAVKIEPIPLPTFGSDGILDDLDRDVTAETAEGDATRSPNGEAAAHDDQALLAALLRELRRQQNGGSGTEAPDADDPAAAEPGS